MSVSDIHGLEVGLNTGSRGPQSSCALPIVANSSS